MGEPQVVFPYTDRIIQLPGEHQEGTIYVVCFRNEGMTCIPIDNMVHVIPDAHRATSEVSGTLFIQKHDLASIHLCTEDFLHILYTSA